MNTVNIIHGSRLRRALHPEYMQVKQSKQTFAEWLTDSFKCHVDITKRKQGFAADYKLTFDSTRKKLMFEIKYAEYL